MLWRAGVLQHRRTVSPSRVQTNQLLPERKARGGHAIPLLHEGKPDAGRPLTVVINFGRHSRDSFQCQPRNQGHRARLAGHPVLRNVAYGDFIQLNRVSRSNARADFGNL